MPGIVLVLRNFSANWLLCLCIAGALPTDLQANQNALPGTDQSRYIIIEEGAIGRVILQLEKHLGIHIQGLEHRREERISFHAKGSPEVIVKRFLKQIAERDFALFYRGSRLSRVVIVDGRKTGPKKVLKGEKALLPAKKSGRKDQKKAEELRQVTHVRDVIKNTTAHRVGIEPGDIVLEYDGVKITHYNELKKQTQLKAHKSQVSMLIVRDRMPQRLFLDSGTIGIVMGLSKMPAHELESYYKY